LDSTLVDRARAGDHDAFAVLAAASIDGLYRIARQIVRDPGLAEDVVQETLVAAWVGLPGLRDADKFEAWLRRLLVRTCTRTTRLRGRTTVREIGLLDVDAPARDDAEKALVVRDLLERGFERLTADERALLVLHFYADVPVAEIADLFGIPPGTVKSRIHRASQRMRALLDADDRLTVQTTGAIS
jgi:RNA polymerase sigma-70 factor (ECF subfamily)